VTTLNREYEKSEYTQHVSDSKNEGEIAMKCENFDKIDPELSKRSVSGINNIISPHDIIDKIWSEEDDTI